MHNLENLYLSKTKLKEKEVKFVVNLFTPPLVNLIDPFTPRQNPGAVGPAWERRITFGPNPAENEALGGDWEENGPVAEKRWIKVALGGSRGAAGVALMSNEI